MKILRMMFFNYLVLIIGITALSLKQVCAMESGVLNESLHPVEMKLKGALRAVIWDRLPQPNGEDLKVGGPMETTYGYNTGLSENVLKGYATLIYAVAGADGISEDESAYIKGQFKLLCAEKQASGISQSVIEEHLAELDNKASAREFKEGDLKSYANALLENLREIGNTSDIFIKVSAKCALYDALMASRADGDYSNLERKATESAAKVLNISNNELELLQEGCEIVTSLNRDREIITNPDFVEKVDAVYGKVNRYYTIE